MDVIKLLENDHSDVSEKFRRFNIADKAETKDEIAKEIVHDLSVHAAIEELFFYPLVRLKLDGETADHAIEEHAEVKRLLADVEKSEAGSAAHQSAMDQIIESVRHHIEEEETDVFSEIQEKTDSATLERLGSMMETAKKTVPTHPHPLVPGTATAQLMAGPWAAIVDKVRDALGDGPS